MECASCAGEPLDATLPSLVIASPSYDIAGSGGSNGTSWNMERSVAVGEALVAEVVATSSKKCRART